MDTVSTKVSANLHMAGISFVAIMNPTIDIKQNFVLDSSKTEFVSMGIDATFYMSPKRKQAAKV